MHKECEWTVNCGRQRTWRSAQWCIVANTVWLPFEWDSLRGLQLCIVSQSVVLSPCYN